MRLVRIDEHVDASLDEISVMLGASKNRIVNALLSSALDNLLRDEDAAWEWYRSIPKVKRSGRPRNQAGNK